MTFTHGVIRAHLHFSRITFVGRFLERHILRNIHNHGAWTTTACNMEGLFHGDSQIANVLDQEVVLHDWARDAHGIALLKSIQSNRRGRHLAGDDHHGDAVHIGRCNACDSIGHPGSRCDQCNSHLPRGTRITVGGMHSSLLMPNQHMLHGVLLVQGVVNVED